MFSPGSNQSNKSREYELVSATEAGYGVNSLTRTDVDHITEAYIVPPMAEAQVISSNNIYTERINDRTLVEVNQSRLQELKQSSITANDGGFRDIWAALLFGVNIFVIVYWAVQGIYIVKTSIHNNDTSSSDSGNMDSEQIKLLKYSAVMIVTLMVLASAAGSWVLSFLIDHAESLIDLMMWGNIVVQAISAILCLLTLQIIGTIIFGALAMLNLCYYWSVRNQIPFSSAVLGTACAAVKANYAGIITTAYSALFMQLVWILVWTVAFAAVVNVTSDTNQDSSNTDSSKDSHGESAGEEEEQNMQNAYIFLLLVSLYWGVQVIKGVVQTTVAGTLACWWFQPRREAPVRGSLFRALTTSFGSICFGSLLVAIIQALREMLNMLRRQAERSRERDNAGSAILVCFIGVLDMLMGCLERAMQYFNKYAYCYIAAYGLQFLQAGRLVSDLFYTRGWTVIINDDLIARALMCGVIACTVLTMIFGVLLSLVMDMFFAIPSGDMGTLALIGAVAGAVVGAVVGLVLTNALDSAVAMVFVCFAEDPLALQKNHPGTYIHLREKWDSMHPGTLHWCSGLNTNNNNPPPAMPVSAPVPIVQNPVHQQQGTGGGAYQQPASVGSYGYSSNQYHNAMGGASPSTGAYYGVGHPGSYGASQQGGPSSGGAGGFYYGSPASAMYHGGGIYYHNNRATTPTAPPATAPYNPYQAPTAPPSGSVPAMVVAQPVSNNPGGIANPYQKY